MDIWIKVLSVQTAVARDIRLATDVTDMAFIPILTTMGNKPWKNVLDVTGRGQLNARAAGGVAQ